MTFHRTDENYRTTLRIDGSLDALSAPEIRPAIEALVTEKRLDVTVELSGLDLIDSSGIGVLVAIYKRVRAIGGTVVMVGVSDQPLAIFKLLKLQSLIAPVA